MVPQSYEKETIFFFLSKYPLPRRVAGAGILLNLTSVLN